MAGTKRKMAAQTITAPATLMSLRRGGVWHGELLGRYFHRWLPAVKTLRTLAAFRERHDDEPVTAWYCQGAMDPAGRRPVVGDSFRTAVGPKPSKVP